MSTSLATRTTLGLIPLAIGILLRHYYDKVLKDKNKGKNGDGPVPLRLEELMYDEAFTLTRVSSLHSSSCLSQPPIDPINRTLWIRQRSTSLPYPLLLAQPSCECSHTVEELQQFANLHTPAGPSSHIVRLTVPQSCCSEAARVLVRALGGETEARRVVGGVRWWQVRPGDGG